MLGEPLSPVSGECGVGHADPYDVGRGGAGPATHYPTCAGGKTACTAAVEWLSAPPIRLVGVDDIALAHGGQNAIILTFQALRRERRPAVLVEDPAYPGFRRAAEMLRAKVVPVAMYPDGIIPEALIKRPRRMKHKCLFFAQGAQSDMRFNPA